MTRGGTNRLIRSSPVLLALVLAATACTGSATLTETGGSGDASATSDVPRATVAAEEPTVAAVEPTAVPAEPTPETQAPEPTAQPRPSADLVPAEFRVDNILAISADGSHIWAGATSPWNTETPCDAPPAESLAVLSIDAATRGDIDAVGAGLEQTGDIRQFVVGDEDSAAILSSCGRADVATVWLQRAEIDSGGQIVGLGEVLPIGGPDESDAYVLGWLDDDVVDARVIIKVDPDDYETWIVERRTISMNTGEIVAAEQFSIMEDDGFAGRSSTLVANGFTYRVIDDPNGSVGCEGVGVAQILELDDGTSQRTALTQPDLVFSAVDELQLASTGHIAWTSGCEGYVSAFVGKLQADGVIADAHLIDTYAIEADPDDYADYRFYRLTDDGFLVGVGQRFDNETAESELAVLRYDLATDPNFVNTAEPPVDIGASPLFDALEDGAGWHVGETLGANRACGGKTLYARNSGGYVRAFPEAVELDAIVDVDVAETRVIEYDEGDDFVSRTVVVQTECPGDYDGRRVWFGLETDHVVWGLTFDRADLGEVADVLSVRDVLQPGTDFVESSIVEVELFDGSFVEVELVRLPQS